MKMKKLLSIGALTLTLVTCTSMSAFAAESLGNKNAAVKKIAMNAWGGSNVINNLSINSKTPVDNYVKQALIDQIKESVKATIGNEELATKVNKTIQYNYDNGKGAKEIFEALQEINQEQDITTDVTFDAAKAVLTDILNKFEDAKSNDELTELFKTYFKTPSYGTLEYGKNSNNEKVVTLKKDSNIVLQISSGNVYNLKAELENNINSWADLNDYFAKIK